MKPFNPEQALAGAPVITRSGPPVTQLTKFDASNEVRSLVGVVDGCLFVWYSDTGRYLAETDYPDDLFMVQEKREGEV